MKRKLFDINDRELFEAKVEDLKRKHLMKKQLMWKVHNPVLYENEWAPHFLVTENSHNISDVLIDSAREFEIKTIDYNWAVRVSMWGSAAISRERPLLVQGK